MTYSSFHLILSGVLRWKGRNALTNADNPRSFDVIGPFKDRQSLPSTILLVLAWSKFSWFSVYVEYTMAEYNGEFMFPESDDPSTYFVVIMFITYKEISLIVY